MSEFLEYTEVSRIIGGYSPDGEGIFQESNSLGILMDKPYERFIPMISGFSRNHQVELEILDPVQRENKLGTYDRNNPNSSLAESVIRTKYIDVTRNDLSFSSDIVILNFTDKAISVCNDRGIVKMYAPIRNETMESHRGHIYFLEVTSLNNPDFTREYFEDTDYVATMMTKYNQKVSKASPRELFKAIDLYTKAKEIYDSVIINGGTFTNNSIKVINLLPIDNFSIQEMYKGKEIHVLEYKALMSMKGPSEMGLNKYLNTDYTLTSNVLSLLSKHNITCFINDPHNEIGERFTYIAGNVVRIPKIQDRSQRAKFHMRFSGLEVTRKHELLEDGILETSLIEMDDLPYIYKTVEDAEVGANRELLAEKEFIIRENALRNEKLRAELELSELKKAMDHEKLKADSDLLDKRKEIESLKMEMETLKASNDINRTERKDDFEEKKYEREMLLEEEKAKLAKAKERWDLEREQLKADLARSNYNHEREMNSIKYQQENNKTNNEAVLQTLKTIGGVVALAAVGYTIYKNFSK